MNANQFKEQFRELMERAYAKAETEGVPLPTIIVECELASAKASTVLLAVEEQQRAMAMTRRIVPASGPLPPVMKKPGT